MKVSLVGFALQALRGDNGGVDLLHRRRLDAPSWRQLNALHRQISAEVSRRLSAAENLSLAEYEVLTQFADQKCTGHRMTELADRVGVSASTATRLVSRLEARGLLQRCPSPEDGRGVRAERTAIGSQVLRRAAELADAVVAEAMAQRTPAAAG